MKNTADFRQSGVSGIGAGEIRTHDTLASTPDFKTSTTGAHGKEVSRTTRSDDVERADLSRTADWYTRDESCCAAEFRQSPAHDFRPRRGLFWLTGKLVARASREAKERRVVREAEAAARARLTLTLTDVDGAPVCEVAL